MYLLVQAFQHLWLVSRHEVYQQFTPVGHTIKPGTLSASMLTDISSPHGYDETFRSGYPFPVRTRFRTVGYL
jgi:hypothetical protein